MRISSMLVWIIGLLLFAFLTTGHQAFSSELEENIQAAAQETQSDRAEARSEPENENSSPASWETPSQFLEVIARQIRDEKEQAAALFQIAHL